MGDRERIAEAEVLRNRYALTIHVAEMEGADSPHVSVIPAPVWEAGPRTMEDQCPGAELVSRVYPIGDPSCPVQLHYRHTVVLDGKDYRWRHRFLRPDEPWARDWHDPRAADDEPQTPASAREPGLSRPNSDSGGTDASGDGSGA